MGEYPLLYPSCGSLWNNLRRPCEALVGSSLLHQSSLRGTGGLPKGGRIPPDYLMRPPLGVFGPFSTRKDTYQYRIVKRCNLVAALFLLSQLLPYCTPCQAITLYFNTPSYFSLRNTPAPTPAAQATMIKTTPDRTISPCIGTASAAGPNTAIPTG